MKEGSKVKKGQKKRKETREWEKKKEVD